MAIVEILAVLGTSNISFSQISFVAVYSLTLSLNGIVIYISNVINYLYHIHSVFAYVPPEVSCGI